MTPAGPQSGGWMVTTPLWLRRISLASMVVGWTLFTASLFLPAIASPLNSGGGGTMSPGWVVLLMTFTFFWFIPYGTVFCLCNLVMITSPLFWRSSVPDDLGSVYTTILTGAACAAVPWAFWFERPIGPGCVLWGLSFYFVSAGFLAPVLYRRCTGDE